MGKTGMLALAQICKNKGQSASFLIITLLAAILMNLGLVTAFDYSRNFDRRAQALDTADAVFFAQYNGEAFIKQFKELLQKDNRTAKVESRPILQAGAEFTYSRGKQSRQVVFLNAGDKSGLDRLAIVEETEEPVENPIYLPWLFLKGGGYQTGDRFSLSLYAMNTPEQTIHFTVAGFYEETFLATINSTTTGFALEDEEYRKLAEKFDGLLSGTMFSVRLTDRRDGDLFTGRYYTALKDLLPDDRLSDSAHYAAVKSARTLTSSIGAVLIVCFALLITAVSLVVLRFRIGNSIEEEMQNIGALKAIGYTSRQIRASILLQFSALSVLGVIFGIALSYAVLPALSDLFAAQTGVVWKQGFEASPAAATLLFLLGTVLLVTLFTTRRVKKLPPIVAIRSGLLTHSFKRNFFPLEKTRGNLIFALSGKSFCHNTKQNVLIGLIAALVSFSAVFAGVMYYNIVANSDAFVSLIAGETPSAQAEAVNRSSAEMLLREIRGMKEVKKAFFYSTARTSSVEAGEVHCYVADDFSMMDNQDVVFKGRFPIYENEVAVNGMITDISHKKIGDRIALSVNEAEKEYLITGITQGSNYMGHDAYMTTEGYRLLSRDYWLPAVFVYLKEGEETEAFLEKLKSESSHVGGTTNMQEMIDSSMGSYQSTVSMLIVVIAAGTVSIIALVLYLVVKTVLIRRKKELGILKAVGFTTWQLALQSAGSFSVIVAMGALLGCIGGYFGVNPLLGLLFTNIGIMKVAFAIPLLLLTGIFIAITLAGFLVSLLVSMRIRKITPCSLVSE